MLESLLNKVAGLTPILKNICQRLLLYCTHTTHCYLSILLYIQHFLPDHHCYYLEAVVWSYSIKKVLLQISQNSLEKTCARVSFLIKLQGLDLQLYQKRDSGTGVSLVTLAKFLGTLFVTEYL